MPPLRDWLREVDPILYILVTIFAISSWVDINGLWVELPLLVNQLPEGWNLPSYLVIIIQVANIGPLIYTVANRLVPGGVREWPVIYVIISVGMTSCALLVVFWDYTSYVGGVEHSTGLLSLSACLALVDCTSSVVYLPYMVQWKAQYMTAFYTGEGLSGFIPALVGLIQGVGGDPNCVNTTMIVRNETTGENSTEFVVVPEYKPPLFSVEVFFIFLFSLILMSGVAFTFIHWWKGFKLEQLRSKYSYNVKESAENGYRDSQTGSTTELSPEDYVYGSDDVIVTSYVNAASISDSHEELSDDSTHFSEPVYSGNKYGTTISTVCDKPSTAETKKSPSVAKQPTYELVYLLLIIAWICALTNGVLPSTQSYSALPYGMLAYNLTVKLSSMANPLACFVALFLSTKSRVAIVVLTLLGTALTAYQLCLAALSPYPPLHSEVAGTVLVVSTSVLLVGFFSYVKVTIASILGERGGRTALLWCGGVTQIGSLVGAVITFVLVNVLQLFRSLPPCQT